MERRGRGRDRKRHPRATFWLLRSEIHKQVEVCGPGLGLSWGVVKPSAGLRLLESDLRLQDLLPRQCTHMAGSQCRLPGFSSAWPTILGVLPRRLKFRWLLEREQREREIKETERASGHRVFMRQKPQTCHHLILEFLYISFLLPDSTRHSRERHYTKP